MSFVIRHMLDSASIPSAVPLVVWPHALSPLLLALKGAKGTISLVQAKDVVPGPNCMLKSLWR